MGAATGCEAAAASMSSAQLPASAWAQAYECDNNVLQSNASEYFFMCGYFRLSKKRLKAANAHVTTVSDTITGPVGKERVHER